VNGEDGLLGLLARIHLDFARDSFFLGHCCGCLCCGVGCCVVCVRERGRAKEGGLEDESGVGRGQKMKVTRGVGRWEVAAKTDPSNLVPQDLGRVWTEMLNE